MSKPVVSIIVPAFNRKRYLRQTLDAIFSQTFEDFEVIVVDDGSTDGTASEVDSIVDPRLILIQTHRKGPAKARNTGVRRASGRFLAFCDSDDLWIQDKLARQISRFDKDDETVMVFSDARFEGQIALEGKTVFSIQRPSEGNIFRPLLLDNFICTSTVVILRDVFEATPGFEDAFCPAEDYRLWLRIARRGRCACINEPLSVYRMHVDQLGADLSIMFPATAKVVSEAARDRGLTDRELPGLAERLWQLHFVAARELMRRGKGDEARFQYRQALRHKVLSEAALFYLLSYLGI